MHMVLHGYDREEIHSLKRLNQSGRAIRCTGTKLDGTQCGYKDGHVKHSAPGNRTITITST
jgi:hypothetical protein